MSLSMVKVFDSLPSTDPLLSTISRMSLKSLPMIPTLKVTVTSTRFSPTAVIAGLVR